MTDDLKERIKAAVNLPEFIERDGVVLKKTGAEFLALCPFHEEKSASFTVFNKDGWFYKCHGCGAAGDIFEWIMRRKGMAFPQALRLAANSVSIAVPPDASAERIFQPDSVKAARCRERGMFDPEKYRALVHGGVVWNYLTQSRRLDGGLLVDYGVGETLAPDWILERDGVPLSVPRASYSVAYKWRPAHWPADREKPLFEFCKCVMVERPKGKKISWRDPAGGKNILFGMCARPVVAAHDAGGELVICEGEIDAITWAQFGYPAVSIPCGASSTTWIDVCFDWLQPFKKIHLSFDEDRAGQLKIREIVTRLGMARTDIVRLPAKISND